MALKQFEVVTSTLVGAEGKGVLATSGKISASGASARFIGVVKVGAAVGSLATVAMPGEIAPVLLGGTAYRGDTLLVNSSSTFEASTPSDGDIVAAICLEAGVSGALVDALIMTPYRYEAG